MSGAERTRRGLIGLLVLAALALAPAAALWLEQPFYVSLFARVMIFAIAALSLDLILGFGGMVSFGHAAYLGVGAYAVGICISLDLDSGWLHLLAIVLASAALAAAIGAICLRTGGVYLIIITLAVAPMLFYLGVSL
jgi:branched-chain amino acid transport system permease protein